MAEKPTGPGGEREGKGDSRSQSAPGTGARQGPGSAAGVGPGEEKMLFVLGENAGETDLECREAGLCCFPLKLEK